MENKKVKVGDATVTFPLTEENGWYAIPIRKKGESKKDYDARYKEFVDKTGIGPSGKNETRGSRKRGVSVNPWVSKCFCSFVEI